MTHRGPKELGRSLVTAQVPRRHIMVMNQMEDEGAGGIQEGGDSPPLTP